MRWKDSYAPDKLQITTGAGKTNPHGALDTISDSFDVDALRSFLDRRESGQETWWSFARWSGDHRKSSNWISASGIAVDIDYQDDDGQHVEIPASLGERVVAVLRHVPVNLVHATPRGFRAITLLNTSLIDASAYRSVCERFGHLIDAALFAGGVSALPSHKSGKWLGGLKVDEGALKDLARMYYAPNACVGGVARVAVLQTLRPEPVTFTELSEFINEEAIVERIKERSFKDAVQAFNRDHSEQWPESGGTCPMCEHHECFGTLPGVPDRWSCFSENHAADSSDCGMPGKGCWHGDALDLHAQRAGISRVALLKRDGYLEAQETSEAQPSVDGTIAEQLVGLADSVELFHDPDFRAYARIRIQGHSEILALRQSGFRRWLVRRYHGVTGKVPGSQAVQDAIGVLEGNAVFSGPERKVHVRIAEHKGAIYLDLADEHWRVVRIDSTGWKVVDESPVMFVRPRGVVALPVPVRGGDLKTLKRYFNVRSDRDWVLLQACLIAYLRPDLPLPVLIFCGEQGSAKSTAQRVLRRLIDPNKAELRSAPRSERDLMIAARNSWISSFDNLSGISVSLSDSFCRLATGGGFGTRSLYSNDEEEIFEGIRPVVLNGIDDVASRGDLLDRAVILRLKRIEQSQRRPEREFWEEFRRDHPSILGAILTALSTGLRRLPDVSLDESPRMADFTQFGVAAESALDAKEGDFLRAYREAADQALRDALDADPLAIEITRLLRNSDGCWKGTPSALHSILANGRSKLPRSAAALSNAIRRLAPSFRAVGIEVEQGQESGAGSRKWIELRGTPQ